MKPLSRRYRFMFFEFALWAMPIQLAGCLGDPKTIIYDIPDEVAIPMAFEQFQLDAQSGQVQAVLDYVLPEYLHMGRDRSELGLWITSLSEFQNPEVSITILTYQVDQDTAQVDYLLSVKSCDKVFDWMDPKPPTCVTALKCKSSHPACGWLRDMRKVDHLWRFSGSQTSWGQDFTLQAEAGIVRLVGMLTDPAHSFSGATVSWTGMEDLDRGTLVLERSTGTSWKLPADSRLPDGMVPGHPLPFDLKLMLESDAGNTAARIRFHTVMDEFASNLLPSGEVMPPFSFSFLSPGKGEGGAQVEVISDGQVLWRSPIFFTSSLPYAGPALEANRSYDYRVRTFDTSGNSSIIGSRILALSDERVPPEPAGISPSAGSAAGGESLTLTGTGFQPGAKVYFDITECLQITVIDSTQIQCTSPSLEPRIYNVLVVNPSGRVGWIPRGFQAV
jgi:hypothetical protein